MAFHIPRSQLSQCLNKLLLGRSVIASKLQTRPYSAIESRNTGSASTDLFWRCLSGQLPILITYKSPSRFISTSEKKKESGISVHQDDISSHLSKPVDTNYVARKDWFCRGVDIEDEDYDTWGYYFVMFCAITMISCTSMWYIAYMANSTWPNKDWATREAYLELHRREKFGLPLIDPDFVPRENIVLPSEEDLKDFIVII